MTAKTISPKTGKIKKLTIEERIELGAQDWKDFQAKQRTQPDYEARMQEAREEIELWEQITLLREQSGLTQGALAKSLGVSQSAIAHLEKAGHEGYTLSTLRKVAHATNHRLHVRFEPIAATPAH